MKNCDSCQGKIDNNENKTLNNILIRSILFVLSYLALIVVSITYGAIILFKNIVLSKEMDLIPCLKRFLKATKKDESDDISGKQLLISKKEF